MSGSKATGTRQQRAAGDALNGAKRAVDNAFSSAASAVKGLGEAALQMAKAVGSNLDAARKRVS